MSHSLSDRMRLNKMKSAALLCAIQFVFASCLNLEYLDPEQLQTTTTAETQQRVATLIIHKYDKNKNVRVHVDTSLFQDSKDVFVLYTEDQRLSIKASSGIAAVWGYNYFLKKYHNRTIGWGKQRNDDIILPKIPNINEKVVATVRFRYFGNPNAFSYTFVWWDEYKWMQHVDWMALNGINVALAPVAQEAAWSRVYRKLGMTQDKIDQYFTGPTYLPFNRLGQLRGLGGPLPESWHQRQTEIQKAITTYMLDLGMIPVFPTFNGHVPRELSDFMSEKSTRFNIYREQFTDSKYSKYCCDIFMDPEDALFQQVGRMFLTEITNGSPVTHLYYAEPFYQIRLEGFTKELATKTTQAIFSTLKYFDDGAVFIVQNTMWSTENSTWSDDIVQSVLTAVPKGRMLVLDMMFYKESYYKASTLYHGQPYVWNMLRPWGIYGRYGDVQNINWDVYEARDQLNSTIVGLAVTPSVMEQNYMLVELVLEAAWRNTRPSLPDWLQQYAARRYGCEATAGAWTHLLNSIYRGYFDDHFITHRPSLAYEHQSWFPSYDLFEAWRKFVFVPDDECRRAGFEYDLIDVTRLALHYRARQLHFRMIRNQYGRTFGKLSREFLDLLRNIGYLLSSSDAFTLDEWLIAAKNMASNPEEKYLYEINSRDIFSSWLKYPDTHVDRHRAELYLELYVPRWNTYFELVHKREDIDIMLDFVERDFVLKKSEPPIYFNTRQFARELYEKYAFMPYLDDLYIYPEDKRIII